ncbi:HD domain-containing protein [Candidatus Dojkabacteria bacterium]|nr:HD domain-containing protein [Candidatus Dojkabacteria bacterium]
MTREAAMQIVDELIDKPNLKKHMLAVEAAMIAYAKRFNENPELWGIAGLLHDADWEKYPDEHPAIIVKKLREMGETDLAHAVNSHGYGYKDWDKRGGEKPESLMAKTLWAVDELTGFIIACSLVRPDKIDGLEVKSVLKRFKEKSFASNVDRDVISKGAAEIGVSIEEHIQTVIIAMRGIKDKLF